MTNADISLILTCDVTYSLILQSLYKAYLTLNFKVKCFEFNFSDQMCKTICLP